MIELYLYGSLRRYARDPRPDRENVLRLPARPGETVAALLDRVGIPTQEVHHVFMNHKLLGSRSTMALWLGYQQVREEAALGQGLDLDVPVEPRDRIALFAADMGLLVI